MNKTKTEYKRNKQEEQMRIHNAFTFGIAILLVIACGGGGKDGDIIDGAIPEDTARGGADGAPRSGDAAPGSSDAAPGSSDAAPGSSDAAPDSGDASPVDDSGAGAPDATTGVDCGGQTCTEGTECCVTAGGASCVETGTCGGATLGCDGPEDCGEGEVCCGGANTRCSPADMCEIEVCHAASDCLDPEQQCCPFAGGSSSVCLDRCIGG